MARVLKTALGFDRLSFCRSFHSKLSPLAVFAITLDRRVAPIVQPQT